MRRTAINTVEWRGHKEVSHNQLLTKSKAGPEESAEREEQKSLSINIYALVVIRHLADTITWPHH